MQMHFDIAVKSSYVSELLTSSGGNCKVFLLNSSFQLIATMIYNIKTAIKNIKSFAFAMNNTKINLKSFLMHCYCNQLTSIVE